MNFFQKLKDQLSIEPSRSFDRSFWRRFDQETSSPNWYQRFFGALHPALPAFALLLIISFFSFGLYQNLNSSPTAEELAALTTNGIDSLDLWEQLDWIESTEDDVWTANEDDWNWLLPEDLTEDLPEESS